jgi:hypothetical protein
MYVTHETGTLVIDSVATAYFSRNKSHNSHETASVVVDDSETSMEAKQEHAEQGRVHPHASHEHAHHSVAMVVDAAASDNSDQLIRNRVISKVP